MKPTLSSANIIDEPIRIDTDEHSLFAILRRHAFVAPRICIIMLNSGMQNRAGPQRLYWRFAQQVASEAIAVLRLDLAGVGDSLSDNTETHFDTHSKDDVNSVVDYVLSTWPNTSIVLQGLCAGSRVALKAAAENRKVGGVLAWSTTIITAGQNSPQSPLEPEDRLSAYTVTRNMKSILRFIVCLKFANFRWWRKRFPGFRGLATEINLKFKSIIRTFVRDDPLKARNDFLNSVDRYLADQRKVLFLYGTKDSRPLHEFTERFPEVPESQSGRYCLRTIKNGTHTFSSLDAQEQAIASSITWLQRQFRSVLVSPIGFPHQIALAEEPDTGTGESHLRSKSL